MDHLTLTGAVGEQKSNHPHDVHKVQTHLNRHAHATHLRVKEDGVFGANTLMAIHAFQRRVLGMTLPDGVVEVFGLTNEWLAASSIARILHPFPVPAGPAKSSFLSDADFQQAASKLKCEVAAIKAVALVETGHHGAFDKLGRPTILYERHIFSVLTKHVYDKSHPDISGPHAKGEYSKPSYPKLERAYRLNPDAALESASWGAFQIMGENYEASGFDSVQDFVASMRVSVQNQLAAFVNFISSNPKLIQAIQEKNWASFALHYNGPAYKKNNYDTKLANAYLQSSDPAPAKRIIP
jgi:hypothetical protein